MSHTKGTLLLNEKKCTLPNHRQRALFSFLCPLPTQNFTILAVALLFLENADGGDGKWYDAGMWGGQASAVLKSSSFVGGMAGMCGMGYLGDVLGIDPAFAVTSLRRFSTP